MPIRQISRHVGEELQEDQEAVQRIVAQIIGLLEEAEEDFVFLLQVADEQRLREVVLILEVIEEAALGDAGFEDDLIERRAGKPLRQHRRLGDVENALARLLAFAECLNVRHLAILHVAGQNHTTSTVPRVLFSRVRYQPWTSLKGL
jgi:hypothetical protein